MSENQIIFRNSKTFIKRGTGICQGILYCGQGYTNYGECSCFNCDGRCGPEMGCPCPDCYYTLSYILYSTGQMNCDKCKSMLFRLNLLNIKKLNGYDQIIGYAITCNLCHQNYAQNYLPFMHCRKCFYNICPNCAFSKISFQNLNTLPLLKLYNGTSTGEGIIYCGRQYTSQNSCICSLCDGKCGLSNGCPCPICDLILGYNIYLNSHMICGQCNKTLLIKTTLIQLQKFVPNYISGFSCNYCKRFYNLLFCQVYHCFKCNFDLCQICAHDIIKGRKILYPYLPTCNLLINQKEKNNDNTLRGKENDEKEEDNNNIKCVICLENDKCMLLMPCKHVCCCEQCSKDINQCPLCRKNIESKTKIYL